MSGETQALGYYLGTESGTKPVTDVYVGGPDGRKCQIFHKKIYHYVSFGDSIAAGHAINSSWDKDYGKGSQYGENGNTSTKIVPGCYTDLIRTKLQQIHKGYISTTSFAHSGDKVVDLLKRLKDDVVKKALAKADYVTICIGANTLLGPALENIGNFATYGNPTLVDLSEDFETAYAQLEADEQTYGSFKYLLKQLTDINPNAQYLFTNIYHPYRYLWIDETNDAMNYTGGYFSPVLTAAPNFEFEFGGVEIDIRKFLYEIEIQGFSMKKVTERINDPKGDGSYSLAEWVDDKINRLNSILSDSIKSFGNTHISMVDTNSIFNSVPDRLVDASVTNQKHYNDLVNVEITKGYTIANQDWGQFWSNWSWGDISSINSIGNEILEHLLAVYQPDIDPHPEEYGHYALYRAFASKFEWESMARYYLSFNSGDHGTGVMETQMVYSWDGNSYVCVPNCGFSNETGFRFAGWNTQKDGKGIAYTPGQAFKLNSDVTLYAQWTNIYTLTYRTSYGNTVDLTMGDILTDKHSLWVTGTNNNLAGKPEDRLSGLNQSRKYYLPYGTAFGIVVSKLTSIAGIPAGGDSSKIYLNGSTQGSGDSVALDFKLTGDVDVDFQYKQWLDGIGYTMGWDCKINGNAIKI